MPNFISFSSEFVLKRAENLLFYYLKVLLKQFSDVFSLLIVDGIDVIHSSFHGAVLELVHNDLQ